MRSTDKGLKWQPTGVYGIKPIFKLSRQHARRILAVICQEKHENAAKFIEQIELSLNRYAAQKRFHDESLPKKVCDRLLDLQNKARELERAFEKLDEASWQLLSAEERGPNISPSKAGFSISDCWYAAGYAKAHAYSAKRKLSPYLKPGRMENQALNSLADSVAYAMRDVMGVGLGDRSLSGLLRAVIEIALGSEKGRGELDVRHHVRRIRGRK